MSPQTLPDEDISSMLPVDPGVLLILKFFIVFTAFFFWVKLLYDWLLGHYRFRRHSRHGEFDDYDDYPRRSSRRRRPPAR